jgi:UDP-galactopyranose mutase
VELASLESGITFIGRLGTYRYLDMHMVIGESLEVARACLSSPLEEWPRFSAPPLPGMTARGTRAAA